MTRWEEQEKRRQRMEGTDWNLKLIKWWDWVHDGAADLTSSADAAAERKDKSREKVERDQDRDRERGQESHLVNRDVVRVLSERDVLREVTDPHLDRRK
jgi:hypothetical protein